MKFRNPYQSALNSNPMSITNPEPWNNQTPAARE